MHGSNGSAASPDCAAPPQPAASHSGRTPPPPVRAALAGGPALREDPELPPAGHPLRTACTQPLSVSAVRLHPATTPPYMRRLLRSVLGLARMRWVTLADRPPFQCIASCARASCSGLPSTGLPISAFCTQEQVCRPQHSVCTSKFADLNTNVDYLVLAAGLSVARRRPMQFAVLRLDTHCRGPYCLIAVTS